MKRYSLFLAFAVFVAGCANVDGAGTAMKQGPSEAQAGGSTISEIQAPRLVFIHASWCETCARYRPAVEELKSVGDVRVQEYDRTSNSGRSFAQDHGIFYQPAFVIYDGSGDLVYAGVGPARPSDLDDWVDEKLEREAPQS